MGQFESGVVVAAIWLQRLTFRGVVPKKRLKIAKKSSKCVKIINGGRFPFRGWDGRGTSPNAPCRGLTPAEQVDHRNDNRDNSAKLFHSKRGFRVGFLPRGSGVLDFSAISVTGTLLRSMSAGGKRLPLAVPVEPPIIVLGPPRTTAKVVPRTFHA